MDTHVTAHPGVDTPAAAFAGPVAGDPGEAPRTPLAAEERPPRRRRSRLLSGVAAFAVVAVGAGAYLTSPYTPLSPADSARVVASARHLAASAETLAVSARHLATSAGLRITAFLAPAAAVANAPHPEPARAVRTTFTPLPRASEVKTVEVLHDYDPSAPGMAEAGITAPVASVAPVAPVAPATAAMMPSPEPIARAAGWPVPAAAAPGGAAGEIGEPAAQASGPGAAPASTPATPADTAVRVGPAVQQSVPSGPVEFAALAAPPAVTPQATPPASSVTPVPAGPVQEGVVALQTAAPAEVGASAAVAPVVAGPRQRGIPMTAPEQTAMLSSVTRAAAMVTDMKVANRNLVERFAQLDAKLKERLDDLERRVALAEANNALNDAAAAGGPVVPVAAQAGPVSGPPGTTARPGRSARNDAAAAPAAGPRHWRIQAASDRLAMLAAVDAAGHDGAQMQAVIGDDVPGCGPVKAILQRGIAWVVQTEHCAIQ